MYVVSKKTQSTDIYRAVKLSTKYNAEIEDRKIFCDKTVQLQQRYTYHTGCVKTCSLLILCGNVFLRERRKYV